MKLIVVLGGGGITHAVRLRRTSYKSIIWLLRLDCDMGTFFYFWEEGIRTFYFTNKTYVYAVISVLSLLMGTHRRDE